MLGEKVIAAERDLVRLDRHRRSRSGSARLRELRDRGRHGLLDLTDGRARVGEHTLPTWRFLAGLHNANGDVDAIALRNHVADDCVLVAEHGEERVDAAAGGTENTLDRATRLHRYSTDRCQAGAQLGGDSGGEMRPPCIHDPRVEIEDRHTREPPAARSRHYRDLSICSGNAAWRRWSETRSLRVGRRHETRARAGDERGHSGEARPRWAHEGCRREAALSR